MKITVVKFSLVSKLRLSSFPTNVKNNNVISMLVLNGIACAPVCIQIQRRVIHNRVQIRVFAQRRRPVEKDNEAAGKGGRSLPSSNPFESICESLSFQPVPRPYSPLVSSPNRRPVCRLKRQRQEGNSGTKERQKKTE